MSAFALRRARTRRRRPPRISQREIIWLILITEASADVLRAFEIGHGLFLFAAVPIYGACLWVCCWGYLQAQKMRELLDKRGIMPPPMKKGELLPLAFTTSATICLWA